MSKYGFLVESSDEKFHSVSDRLRLHRFGAWRISERREQERLAKQQASQTLGIIRLAKKIASVKQIEFDAAWSLLQQNTTEATLILSDFADEMDETLKDNQTDLDRDICLMTLFLRSRGQGLIDGEWKDLSDWSEADTCVLTEIQQEALITFINQEQIGGSSPLSDDEAEEQVEVSDEGKPGGSALSESASKS